MTSADLLSIKVEDKPTNHKQECYLCGLPIKKGEKRVSIPYTSYAGYGKYFVWDIHFHYSCFLYWLSKNFPEIKLPNEIIAEVVLRKL